METLTEGSEGKRDETCVRGAHALAADAGAGKEMDGRTPNEEPLLYAIDHLVQLIQYLSDSTILECVTIA